MTASPAEEDSDADAARSGAAAGQRRQVTVLFADMAGYTPLAEQLGEERTYLLMQRVHRALTKAVHGHGGTVQEITGDGVMALFGAPAAIEDAPLQACRAALDIQARIAALAADAETGGLPLGFRVGIHSGPLFVGAVGDDHHSSVTALGDTVNLAARIEGQAGTGEVFLSEATHALVEGYVVAEFAGERTIKGKAAPQPLWRLDKVREGLTRFGVARGRGLTPLAGRRDELAQLETLWAEARAGAVRAATILGDPGIGKSRLAWELARHAGDEGATVLEGHCSAATGDTPFAPLIQVVRTALGVPEGGAGEALREVAERGLAELGLCGDARPYLLDLLGHAPADAGIETMAGEILGIRTRDAIHALLRGCSRAAPVMLLIDDLQWADTATEGLLQRLAQSGEAVPLLLLATARAGHPPPFAGVEIALEPLSGADSEALLCGCLGVDGLPAELTRLVAGRSEGNPLFAEEIAAYLRESGAVRIEGGTAAFAPDASTDGLPVSVQNLLMGRIDRLEDGPRALLETASVIGPRFAGELALRASAPGGASAADLDALVRAGLVRAEAGDTWCFRHGLACEAVYDSLLTPRRQTLHERVATAIEETGRPDDAAEALARHWSRTDRADKAVRYLALAGGASLRVYSLDEAERHFRQALILIEEQPDWADDSALADILLSIARVLYFKGEFLAIIGLVGPYLPRIEALGVPAKLARFLFETGYAHVFTARIDEGRTLLERARALGEETGDALAAAYAELGLMWDRMLWGTPGATRQQAQREAAAHIVAVALAHDDVWLASKAQVALAGDLQAWGRMGEARDALGALMDMGQRTGDPRPRAMALWGLAALDAYAGDHTAAIEHADGSLAISLGPLDRDSALVPKATAMIRSGQVDEGLALIADIAEAMEVKGMQLNLPAIRMVLGAGTVLAGRLAHGARIIREAIATAERWGQSGVPTLGRLLEAEIAMELALRRVASPEPRVAMRNLPFLLWAVPFAGSRARRQLERVLAELRARDMPVYVAQCLYDLGLLAAKQGDSGEARSRFAEARALAADAGVEHLVRLVDAAGEEWAY